MSGLLLYIAKRSLIDQLGELLPENTAQVSYGFPANPERTLVYSGAARFSRTPVTAESSAPAAESAVLDLWLRVQELGGDIRSAEQSIEGLALTVIGVLTDHTLVGPGFTFSDVSSGVAPETIASPTPSPTVTARLQLQVTVRGIL